MDGVISGSLFNLQQGQEIPVYSCFLRDFIQNVSRISIKYYKMLTMFWIQNVDFFFKWNLIFIFKMLPHFRDREHLFIKYCPLIILLGYIFKIICSFSYLFLFFSFIILLSVWLQGCAHKSDYKYSLFSSFVWHWGYLFLKGLEEFSNETTAFGNFTLCTNFKYVFLNH